ncbi:hypothetical protein FRC09_019825, partial [Ceratobasidium sp. 395]
MQQPPPRQNRFQAPIPAMGLPSGPRLAPPAQRAAPTPVANQQQRRMYLAGANTSATGSAAQLLNPSVRTLPGSSGSGGNSPEPIHAALAQAPEGY